MKRLVDLGHKRIGFIGGSANAQSSQDKMAVHREILAEQMLPVRKSWAVCADLTQAAGWNGGYRMLNLPHCPTAIFAANDMIALGALAALEGLGLRVPENLFVVGYDDIRYVLLPRIQLATVAQPTREMGRIATEYLVDVAEGRRRRLRKVLPPNLAAHGAAGAQARSVRSHRWNDSM